MSKETDRGTINMWKENRVEKDLQKRPTSMKRDLLRYDKYVKRDPCSSKETSINCKET